MPYRTVLKSTTNDSAGSILPLSSRGTQY